MITLSGIRKTYRTKEMETVALDDVGLDVGKGEFVALVGPSGCGKSSLLHVAGLIDRPDAGQYIFDGEDISAFRESRMVEIRRQHVGFIFQSFNLLEDLTVFENVELPLLYQNVPKARRRDRVREVLELVGLDSRARHRPAQLSGGQQQRAAVARAVVGDPKLILADEPTGNLDAETAARVLDLFAAHVREAGAATLLVTHSKVAAACADRTVKLTPAGLVGNDAG